MSIPLLGETDRPNAASKAVIKLDSSAMSKSAREAELARSAVTEGYLDAIAGRTVPFNGNLRRCMEAK